jgi:aryl-alcohol dehydrogenase-like predicted oxidoreductase
MGRIVLVAYRLKPRKEARLPELARDHVTILRGEGLATRVVPSARARATGAPFTFIERHSAMRYKLLGGSGLRVSELALGTMTFGEEWGWGASREESLRMFNAFVELGGNFIDTANRYTDGTSERLVGKCIASDRERFVVATKYTLMTRQGDPNFSGNHRKNMVQSLEASLQRLQTGYVDLFWVHAWDFTTAVEEVMRGLDDLVRQGKVLHVGISDTPAWVISQANTLAVLRGWTPFVALQLRYSLIDRAAERDLLPMARAFDLAVMPWSVLGAGVLSGKYNRPDPPADGRAKQGAAQVERNLRIAAEAMAVAREIGCTPSQVAISWVRRQPGVIIPLVGARNLEQLRDNLGALQVQLSDAQLTRLGAASQIELGFPHDFLGSDSIREVVFGGAFGRIDNHRDRTR